MRTVSIRRAAIRMTIRRRFGTLRHSRPRPNVCVVVTDRAKAIRLVLMVQGAGMSSTKAWPTVHASASSAASGRHCVAEVISLGKGDMSLGMPHG